MRRQDEVRTVDPASRGRVRSARRRKLPLAHRLQRAPYNYRHCAELRLAVSVLTGWGLTMLSSEERDLSQAMLRLWGSDAADVAQDYARQHELAGNETAASRWHNVNRIIADAMTPPVLLG
jgi:hypothetical protein